MLRVRVVPQRQVRLLTLHVDTGTATVRSASVAGRNVPVEPGDGKWGSESCSTRRRRRASR
ncbi:hypothetical protein V2I01_09660 [Micromonospora sp. BRA006-A]|nr:hypothetical protein [Micromonospora sp. BRA006-A]